METAMKKITEAQVRKAHDRADLAGLAAENASRRAGYARGNSKVSMKRIRASQLRSEANRLEMQFKAQQEAQTVAVTVIRVAFPKKLDKFAASPVGDEAEFRKAFDVITAAFPNVDFTYVGTDGTRHYFQKWGDPLAYAVPVSDKAQGKPK